MTYTLLNISNGTPEGLPKGAKDLRATLPINQLGFRNAKPIGLRPQLKGNPPLEDCPISNVHRCKVGFLFRLPFKHAHIISYHCPCVIYNSCPLHRIGHLPYVHATAIDIYKCIKSIDKRFVIIFNNSGLVVRRFL